MQGNQAPNANANNVNQTANPATASSCTEMARKYWDSCAFFESPRTRHFFSFLTNATVIGSSAAPLLPTPIKQVVAPALGSVSYASLQAVYRADNDKLRTKVARHRAKYTILRRLLPVAERGKAQYKVAAKTVELHQYGTYPYSCNTISATLIIIFMALAAGGLAGYLANSHLDEWNSTKSIGLGVLTLTLLLVASTSGVIEEHHKKVNLNKIDKEYKTKINAMKNYFFDNNDIVNLKAYHNQKNAIPEQPKLTKKFP